jgi:hypothetical protein
MMQAISNWCRYISTCRTGILLRGCTLPTLWIEQYLDSAPVKKHPELLAEIWEGDFKADFTKSEHGPVVEVRRHSKLISGLLLTCFGVAR